GNGGIAFRLEADREEGRKPVRLRFAWQQSTEEFYLGMSWGAAGLTIASNQDGAWYHALGQSSCIKARQKPMMSPPFFVCAPSQFANALSAWGGFNSVSGPKSTVKTTALDMEKLWAMLNAGYHVHRTFCADGKGGKRVRFTIEPTGQGSAPAGLIEMETDEAG